MKRIITPLLAGAVLLTACTKNADLRPSSACEPDTKATNTTASSTTARPAPVGVWTTYSIGTGKHTCDQNDFAFLQLSQMNFKAKFDSSAIYATANPANQNDINMLYGFSEGASHQFNSARIGWVWSGGALKLYAYAYVSGTPVAKYITTPAIGAENTCSIKLAGGSYTFTVNGVTVSTPRGRTTASTSGYQLYPYFGGTEAAPHAISIKIMGL